MRLSIILPCYNEAANLPLLLAGYHQVWQQDLAAELILVNNGSTDDTAAVLAHLLQDPEFAFARQITVMPNQGYGYGIFSGLQAAHGEFLAFSHADMQCSPADVFRAYEALLAQPEPGQVLIKGKRAPRGLNAALVTNGMAFIASLVLTTRLSDINAQPKLFHRSHLARLKQAPPGMQFDLYVLYQAKRAGLAIETIPVVFGQRAHGHSKWAFSILSRYKTIWAMLLYIFKLRFAA